MTEKEIGKIKNFLYNPMSNDLEITIRVTDAKFKKKILRDFSLAGKLKVEKDIVIYNSEEGE